MAILTCPGRAIKAKIVRYKCLIFVFSFFEDHLIIFFKIFFAQQVPWLKTHHIYEI